MKRISSVLLVAFLIGCGGGEGSGGSSGGSSQVSGEGSSSDGNTDNPSPAADISIYRSRYFMDASGNYKFLLGQYVWTTAELDIPTPSGALGGTPAPAKTFIDVDMVPNGLNYYRFSLGVVRSTNETDPTSWDGTPNLVPFLYKGSPAKADLDQWDPAYWTALKEKVAYAGSKGIIVHVCFFDGALSLQAVNSWKYTFWNIDNQTESFYGDLDIDNNEITDKEGEFWRLGDFNSNTGVGYYQRLLIAKTISELDSYGNVMYELGNETYYAPTDWIEAALTYARSLTNKPVTVNLHDAQTTPSSPGSYATHQGDNPASIKTWIENNVGRGHPVYGDPDGSKLGRLYEGDAHLCRQAAWYSLTGGAAGWGGFTHAYNRNQTTPLYYGYLLNFLSTTGAQFWNMVPSHALISSNSVNSLIAKSGEEYLGYVLSASSATISLPPGTYSVQFMDPATGEITKGSNVVGDTVQTFNRPSGASDWAVFVKLIPAAGG